MTSHNVVLVNFPAFLDDQTIEDWFQQSMNTIQRLIKEEVPYRINVVRKANGVCLGYGYLYVGNSKAINLLHGLEANGSNPMKQILVDNEETTGNWADDSIIIYEECDPPFIPTLIDGKHKVEFKGLAVLQTLASNLQHNVLCCRGYDKTFSIDLIKKELSRYVTSKGRYPKYNFVERSGIIFITFDTKTNDAQNALLMVKKVVINDKLLFFSHAFTRE